MKIGGGKKTATPKAQGKSASRKSPVATKKGSIATTARSVTTTATAAVVAPPKKEKPLSNLELAKLELAKPRDERRSGKVVCRFNHYRKEFPVFNGVLQWKDIDEEYAFSFVYKGDYSKEIQYLEQSAIAPAASDATATGFVTATGTTTTDGLPGTYVPKCISSEYFLGITPGQHYQVVVEEGIEGIGAEGLRINKGPLVSYVNEDQPKAGNAAVKELTNDLLKMNVSDLHSEEAKRIREARDLEDVLFSGP